MFQSFEERTNPADARVRLPRVRAALAREGLDGFIVPHEDEYQNEYLPACAERLAWLTGFTGSAGAAAVLTSAAAIFVDGRYTLQVRSQVDTALFEPLDFKPSALASWLKEKAQQGARIGYDPRLHTIDAIDNLREALGAKGIVLVALGRNPIDTAWDDRPPEPAAPVVPHEPALAGEGSGEKRARIAQSLAASDTDAVVLTSPASLAWLFNIRGGDVPHTPLPLGRAILYRDGKAGLYLDPRKVGADLARHLGADVSLHPPAEFEAALQSLSGKAVAVDAMLAPASVFAALEAAGAHVKRQGDPCVHPRAIKNETEISGTRAAHLRDGAALARFLAWIAREGPKGALTEIEAAEHLEAFRRQTNALKDISFETIPGAGPNGAIVHYRPTVKTNRRIEPGTLLLVDSGAQYVDGTTDVTRTIAIGEPSEEMRRAFTLVLKGHIALATARFPVGTCGVHLDALARLALWKAGLDYDHGTGHGVGSYLGVHEGPQNISRALRNVPLEPGMIISNEPGYYKTGAFGIRIENLVLVTPAEQIEGGERAMLGFETLTLAPIDRRLIVSALLTDEERAWLDAYHARVRAAVGGQIEGDERLWLESATAPL